MKGTVHRVRRLIGTSLANLLLNDFNESPVFRRIGIKYYIYLVLTSCFLCLKNLLCIRHKY